MSQSFPPWRGLVFVSPSTSARTSRSSPAIHSNVHTALPAFSRQQGLTLSLDPQWSSLAYPSTLGPQNPSLPVLALCWITVTNPSKPHCTGSCAIHFHWNLTKRKSGPEVGWWEGRKTVNFSPALSGQYSCSGWVSPWFLPDKPLPEVSPPAGQLPLWSKCLLVTPTPGLCQHHCLPLSVELKG